MTDGEKDNATSLVHHYEKDAIDNNVVLDPQLMSRYFEDRVTDDPYIGLSNHVVGDSSSGPYGTYFDKFFLNSSLF